MSITYPLEGSEALAVPIAFNGAFHLASEASELLQRSPYYSLRAIACEATNGQVVLKGTVGSFYLKQVAQAIAASVVGANGVRNQIRVRAVSPIR